jgi:DNA-binding response OmpR family regulator
VKLKKKIKERRRMNNEKQKIKVAWYENNMQFVEPIKYYLEKERVFEVKNFGSPDIAAEEIAKFKPDMIIFDYRMEKINGVEMFKRIRDRGLDFVPVFFSIWSNDEVTRAEILEVGVESSAIFDKHIEPASFSKALYEYYRSKMTKNG